MTTKTIKNFENYTITDSGIVTNSKTRKVLKQSIANGYYQVCLCQNGKRQQYFVHQLVARTFLGDYDTKTHWVDHIKSEDKLNNNVSNLQIVQKRLNSHNRKDQSQFGIGVIKRENKNEVKYKATININKKNIYLGSFATPELAFNKYKSIADQINKLDLDNKKYKVVKVKKDNEYHLIFLINTTLN